MPFACRGRATLRYAVIALALATLHGQPDQLAMKAQRGKELMSQGRFADAVPIYEELVRIVPTNPGLRLNLALALQMAGRKTDAVPQFERVLKVDPNNLPALLSLAALHLEAGQPATALPLLEKVVTLKPAEVDPRGMLANALLSLNRPKDAVIHFRKLTQLTPQDPKAWFGLGRCYESLAGQAFEELSKTAEGSPQWLLLVADSRMAQRQYRAAFFFYKQAIDKQPALRGAHGGMANVYRATNHEDWAATEDKTEATLAAPDCTREKPECDFKAGRYLDAAAAKSSYWRSRAYNQLALDAFSKLGHLPESVELHALMAGMMAGHGQFLDAAGQWRAALKLTPGDPRLERELAVALFQARDFQAAVPMLQELLKRLPSEADLNFFLGDSYLRLERPSEALPYLDTASKLNPKFLPARASLGLTLMRLERPAEAIPHLLSAVKLDDDGSLHFQLSRAYQSAGDTVKAREAMAKYQEIQRANDATKRDLDEKVKITAP